MNTENLLNLLRAAKPWIEQGGDISGYGFYRPENPHNFHPDPESCSEEEIANHRAACEAWDRGDYKAEPGSESFHNEMGELTLHILRAPWGIGRYNDIATEAADLLAAIDCALNSANERAPSPTHGMNLGERIAHVGGRTNDAGYIEFGSVMAVDALIQHVLRDAQSPQKDPT